MNCCSNTSNKNGSDRNEHKAHSHPMWMMLLCCGAPIIILAVVSLLGTTLPGVKTFMISILPFICPVMMIVMIPMMLKGNRKADHNHNENALASNQLEEKRSIEK